MPACEAQNPAKRFKPPTFCNWLMRISFNMTKIFVQQMSYTSRKHPPKARG